MLIDDGKPGRLTTGSLHWLLGRQLLGAMPAPSGDPFVDLWYRATSAFLIASGDYAAAERHLSQARQVIPDNAHVWLASSVLHAYFARPPVQHAASRVRIPPGSELQVQDERRELQQAQRHLQRALSLDSENAEARLRLGRVLALSQMHEDALRELRIAAALAKEPVQQYYVHLFTGQVESALDRLDSARVSFERAAALFPDAQTPRLALSELAARRGDESGAMAELEPIVARKREARADPWWSYDESYGRDWTMSDRSPSRLVFGGRAMSRIVAAIVFSAVTAGFHREPQQPAFSARTSLVRVDVSVTERGRPVKGLRPADFEIRDNGVPQQIEFVLTERMPLSLALVLDVSGSVAGDRLDHFRTALDRLLERLQSDDRVTLVTFSHEISVVRASPSDRERLRALLSGAKGAGGTSLFDASYAGLALANRADERGLQVVFSDGLDTSSWLSSSRVLEIAKRIQVVTYAVSLAGTIEDRFLRDFVDLTGGAHLRVGSEKELESTFTAILEAFRHRYVLSYQPKGVAAAGWHRIDVRVRRTGASVKARPGYLFQ